MCRVDMQVRHSTLCARGSGCMFAPAFSNNFVCCL